MMNHIEVKHPEYVANGPVQCDPPIHPELGLRGPAFLVDIVQLFGDPLSQVRYEASIS